VVLQVQDQASFDALFNCIYSEERVVAMRAADAIEKITARQPQYLQTHQNELFQMAMVAKEKELKWHLAQLLPRLPLQAADLNCAWTLLTGWALDKKNSRIVRVNALQALFELTWIKPDGVAELARLMKALSAENIPSLNARIKTLQHRL
jgi:hypothetical protein